MNGGIAEGVDLAMGRWRRERSWAALRQLDRPHVEQFPAPRQAVRSRNQIRNFQTVFSSAVGTDFIAALSGRLPI